MNEQFFQASAKKILGLIGYVSGLIAITIGTYLIISNHQTWLDYVPLITCGFVVLYLADIMQASHNKMDMLLRIIKHQEYLFKQTLSSEKTQTPPKTHNVTFMTPEELVNTFNVLGKEFQKIIDDQEKQSFDKLSIDELNKMMDEALNKEDYDKAAFLRDIIEERQKNNND